MLSELHCILVVSNDGVICGNEDKHTFSTLLFTDRVVVGREINGRLLALLLERHEHSVLSFLMVPC